MSHYLHRYPVVPGLTITDLGTPEPTEYSYEEIELHISKLTAGLIKNFVPGQTRIAVAGEISFNYIAIIVAIARARMCFVPINFKLPQPSIDFCLEDSKVDVAFCDNKFADLITKDIPCIRFNSDEYSNLLQDPVTELPEWNPDYINYIMYTSGTTGNPKGVVTTYQSRFLSIARKRDTPVTDQKLPARIAVTGAPLYHLAGLNNVEQELYYSMGVTTHLVLLPVFDARKYLEAVDRYRSNSIRLVAPMMSMILQQRDLIEKLDLTSVQEVYLTSSAAPKKLQDDIKIAFPNVGLIENPYGTTETGPVFGRHPQGIPKPATSCGYPLQEVKVKLDKRGVLLVKSDMLLNSYLNNPDLSSECMTPDGFYITNDIFKVNKYGFYFYLGRADDMFKSGGEKIYPSEIESIIERHHAVALSTVVGVEDDIKGYKPYAFVQLKPNAHATDEEIKQYVVSNVATYQIPRHIWILDELPKTNIGKIDRRHLTNLAKELLQK